MDIWSPRGLAKDKGINILQDPSLLLLPHAEARRKRSRAVEVTSYVSGGIT